MKLEIRQLTHTFNGHPTLRNLSLDCQFSVLGIIGPSGGGKSTLLRVLSGLIVPQQGHVQFDGKQIPFDQKQLLNYRRSNGVVFQSFNLFPHLTALENITLPLHRVQGIPLDEARERGRKLLERFDLVSHADKKIYALSGGQCQRIAIIRAVAIQPMLLFLDEPTSALDPLMTSEVLDLIVELKTLGIACIIVSHHVGFLKAAADRMLFLQDGEILEEAEAKSFFENPRHPLVLDYFAKVFKYEQH